MRNYLNIISFIFYAFLMFTSQYSKLNLLLKCRIHSNFQESLLSTHLYFCFNYSFWLFLRCIWIKITSKVINFFITIWFWKFQFFSFQFLIFINFEIATNSFIYSLFEQFLKPIFTKVITGVRGIFLGKTWQNFQVYIPPYLGYIIRATFEFQKNLETSYTR